MMPRRFSSLIWAGLMPSSRSTSSVSCPNRGALRLCSPGVAHQWLVYSRAGHFSEIVSVVRPATVTAYRLPFWHYTTPLVGTPKAARWVLLGTFLFHRTADLQVRS